MKRAGKRFTQWGRWLLRQVNQISLPDKFLLVFMAILMWQSGYTLFFYEIAAGESGPIDVAVRTSAGSIFGYFIGSAFLKRNGANVDAEQGEETGETDLKTPSEPSINKQPMARIGFSAEPEKPAERGKATAHEMHEKPSDRGKRQQIVIVSLIGILSLILALSARGTGELPPEALATLSQLRDFASGSIGFLIGFSKEKQK